MKIEIEVGLDDLLKEVEDEESGKFYYDLRDKEELNAGIVEKISEKIYNEFNWVCSGNSYTIKKLVEKMVEENKEQIIERVVKDVSKRIINQKAIKDFKKSLDE